MRPVVVTGAAGFAGTHVVEHLLDIGRPVEAWVHRKPERDPGCRYRVIDIRDAGACAEALAEAQPSGVIHLAAITSPREAAAAPERARQVNVHGTHNMLAPLAADVPAVFSSTCHVYGAPDQFPLHEGLSPAPRGVYARSKADAEGAARRAHARVVIARAFHHTGPGQSPGFALAQWARDIEHGISPVRTGDLSLRRDYTDVRDIARGYVHLLDHAPPSDTVNLCSGHAPTLRTLLYAMAGPSGIETERNPAWTRPDDPAEIRGCPRHAAALGWTATTPIETTLADLRATFRRGEWERGGR